MLAALVTQVVRTKLQNSDRSALSGKPAGPRPGAIPRDPAIMARLAGGLAYTQ